MTLAHSEIFQNLHKTLSMALDEMDSLNQDQNGHESTVKTVESEKLIENLRAVVELFALDANKLALGLTNSPISTPEETKSMVNGFKERSKILVSLISELTPDHGRHFQSEVMTSVALILKSATALITDLAKIKSKKEKTELLTLLGGFWEKCEAVSKDPKFPVNNQQSCLRILEEERSLITDALEEMEDALETPDILDGTEMTENEKKIAKSGIGLVKTAQAMLKKITLALRDHGNCSQVDDIEDMDKAVEEVKNISPLVDEFVLALIPPIDPKSVDAKAKDLGQALQYLMESITYHSFIVNSKFSEWGPFLTKALNHNLSKVEATLLELGMTKLDINNKEK